MPTVYLLCIAALCAAPCLASWPQFRGPNATGVSDATGLPVEFGPDKNMIWKTAIPPGQSSPVLTTDRIFLTAFEGQKLFVLCIDRASGKVRWRREVPRPRTQELHESNTPASPSPVTDGKNVYAFFGDFGLISFGPNGEERWKLPLGPFINPMGMAASPVLYRDMLLMICDSESGSFFLAVDKDSGRVKWRTERPDVSRGFATPVIWAPQGEPAQVIIAGSFQLISYSIATGEKLWWVRGLTWQVKPTPVVDGGVIYIQNWAGGSDTGQQEQIAPFEEVRKQFDRNKDGMLAKDEITDEKVLKDWSAVDLDRDGMIGERDWKLYQSRRSAQNSVMAVKLGGRGDMTEKNVLWRYTKSLPNVPSPLMYQGVLYMVKEGGIVTSFNPATGDVYKQARLTGALDQYLSSPVAADGKIYVASMAGKVAVLKPGPQWEILAVNDLEDECSATPAFDDGRIYVRTKGALHSFGKKD